MITIAVRYHNLLRRTVGLAEETITLPEGTSLRDALMCLAQRHGDPLREMLFESEEDVSLHLVIFRNRRLMGPDQHDAPLSDGEQLMLFPAISGG